MRRCGSGLKVLTPRCDHRFNIGKFLTRAAIPGIGDFGFLNFLPVLECHRIDTLRSLSKISKRWPTSLISSQRRYPHSIRSTIAKPSGLFVPIVPDGPRLAQPTQ